MQIDRYSEKPAYIQIADNIREQIQTKQLHPDNPIPSTRELASSWDVDQATARRALNVLVTEGLLRVQRGMGFTVKTKPHVTRIARNRLKRGDQRGFYADVVNAGMTPDVTTNISRAPAPPEIASILEIPENATVVIRDRHMAADGRPLQLATTHFPADLVETLPILGEMDTGPGGMYQRMEEIGHELHQEDIVSARPPTPDEARQLRLDKGVPILTITRITTNKNTNVPLEVTLVRLASERNELRYIV